jgi:hypothetical protein
VRKVALVLALGVVVAGNAWGANPELSAGGGGMNVLDSGREVLWSEPPNLNGLIVSSEIIADSGLESEIANDFVVTVDAVLSVARWWGGYYGNYTCLEIGHGATWNLRFYGDGGCDPAGLIAEYLAADAHETSIACQFDIYPLFQYEAAIDVPIVGGNLYWFGAQATNHVYPPQVGRLASGGVVHCESVFKSVYFSYPDWTAAIDVFGIEVDFSQEFEGEAGPSPSRKATWGAVKGLYR